MPIELNPGWEDVQTRPADLEDYCQCGERDRLEARAVELTGALKREAVLQARLDGFEGDGTDDGSRR